MRDVETHRPKLHVETRHFLEAELDEANVGDLRPEVKVNQLEHVQPAEAAELIDQRDKIGGVQAELRLLTTAFLPPPEAAARQLDADACGRRDTKLVGDLEKHVDFGQLLDDDEHLVAKLLAHQGEAHELLVLVSVADDQMIRVLGETKYRLKLRLAAALEPHAVLLPELDDLLHHVAL